VVGVWDGALEGPGAVVAGGLEVGGIAPIELDADGAAGARGGEPCVVTIWVAPTGSTGSAGGLEARAEAPVVAAGAGATVETRATGWESVVAGTTLAALPTPTTTTTAVAIFDTRAAEADDVRAVPTASVPRADAITVGAATPATALDTPTLVAAPALASAPVAVAPAPALAATPLVPIPPVAPAIRPPEPELAAIPVESEPTVAPPAPAPVMPAAATPG